MNGQQTPVSDRMHLRLYVAGDEANSRIARENLKAICASNGHAGHEIEIVDVLQHPERALERGVFVTPALEILSPAPGGMIYGNLSDRDALCACFPQADGTGP
ncbi:MAG: circadian clock KaiB family protein [Planctomycetota bacterium]